MHAESSTLARMRTLCDANGYTDYHEFDNERDACIVRLLFTYAILADLNEWGYGDRWCFHSYADARRALDAWDGESESRGWHRPPFLVAVASMMIRRAKKFICNSPGGNQ
jgi:hypothetical protein